MSLSALIVQREVASMRHVEEALARQVIYGGDLPTNLLEVARLDEKALTAVLAETMHLRPAPPGELPSAPERVSSLVPPQMAVQRAMIPLVLEQDRLVLAVAEPLPRDVEEQLAFALGMGIEQRVSTLVRVRQAQAKTYGVPLERRMERLIARMSGLPSTAGSMPPPLGAAPSVLEPPRAPSAPPAPRPSSPRALPVSRPAPASLPAPFPAPLPAPQPAPRLAPLPAPLPAPSAPPPEKRPPSEAPAAAIVPEKRAGLLQREPAASARTARRRRGPVTLDVAKAEAEDAGDRDTLLDLFFDFARQFFDYSALFLVHGDIAEGREAFGAGASREKVVGIGVPLDLPGLMSTARDQRTSSVIKVPADGLDAVLLADLQRPPNVEIAIVPLVVRRRAVALLVGDCGEAGVDRASMQQVVAFSGIVGKAFERIIVRRKLEGFIAGSAAAGTGRIDPSLVPPKKPSAPPSQVPPAGPSGASEPPPPAEPRDARTATLVSVGPPAALHRASIPAVAADSLQPPPPPPVNLSVVRNISGPPIPREEPDSPREESPLSPARPRTTSAPRLDVRSVGTVEDEDTGAIFDELGWETDEEPVRDGPPPSAAIAVPAHSPANRSRTDAPLPSVIVDVAEDVQTMVDRVITGEADETVEGDLLRMGEAAMRGIMARFPGPVSLDRSRVAGMVNPPRASDTGPVLRLVARQRRVALPFVLERISDANPDVRAWATHVLAELPYREAIPHLVVRLRDEDPSTRTLAVLALVSVARASPDEVRAAMIEMAHATEPGVRAAAMRVMGELRSPALVPDLVRALGDGDEAVVEAARRALVLVTRQDLGTDARRWLRWWEQNAQRNRIEWLIDSLTHEVSEIRRAAGDELKALTKEYFGYASDLPPRDRERAQQRYRDWWVTEGRIRSRRVT